MVSVQRIMCLLLTIKQNLCLPFMEERFVFEFPKLDLAFRDLLRKDGFEIIVKSKIFDKICILKITGV